MPFFDTPDRNDKITIDYSRCRPISVVMSHKANGQFIPIYFRAIKPDESEQTVKIDIVKFIKEKKGCISFHCLVTNYDRQQEVILTFYVLEHIWVLENKY